MAEFGQLAIEKVPLFALVGAVITLTLLAQSGGSAMNAGSALGLTDQ